MSTRAAPAIPARPAAAAIALDIIANAQATAGQIASLQAERLTQLLRAALHTPYYRRALRGLDPAQVPLHTLPARGKGPWMAHFAQGVADPRITLAGVRDFCADARAIGAPFLQRYVVWESSGSGGEPGLFVQDATAMAVYDALEATRRSSPRPWLRCLDPLYLSERIAFAGAVGGHFASQVSVQRLRACHPWLAQNWRSFSILQPTAALVAQLNDFAPSIVATYPSAAVLLAEQAARGKLRIRAREVWTGGETLSDPMRRRIEQGLDCALRNSYGASEFLPIAWECEHRRLHLNADWVILEAVDAQHQPVPPGRLSHTTLLTNLANHVQPLIRFDIGDRIAFDREPCACGSALPTLQVHGRHDDTLHERARDGSHVTLLPLALSTLLEQEAGVFDFELRQHEARRWRLTLGPGATPDLRARCRRLLAAFAQSQGVHGLRIGTRVASLPPSGRSGKRQRIVAAGGRAP